MAERLRVEVVFALPDRQYVLPVELPAGATAIEAVRSSGLAQQIALPEPLELSIFGRPCPHDSALADGDRVEVLRPLVCDPKESRRRRAAHAAARRHQSPVACPSGSVPARSALPTS
jgi:putative ubiquitin-RnfH superfamily antitoxin RatB of RatAB toxin-antitoxin module